MTAKPDASPVLVEASEPEERAAFGPEVSGLWLKRSIVVRAQPSLDGDKLGTVAAHTVVGWQRALKAEGCESRWIEIEPKGWVCESYLSTTDKRPHGVELPKLSPGEHVPGLYGKVVVDDAKLLQIKEGRVHSSSPIVGSSTVRKRGEIQLNGKRYWKVDGGDYLDESHLRIHNPSTYRGSHLRADSMPIGFVVSGKRPGDWVVVLDGSGKRVTRLPARSVVSILGTELNEAGDPTTYRIGDDMFIRSADIRLVSTEAPPPLVGELERWVDVDLDTQVLVAYEGKTPIYATLIASGTKKNPTETGIFRIWIKFAETNMSGRMGESDAYSVAKVPWTQFYENDFALHTSYWHDRFGQKRSHGCINLSPRDSRFLYFWSDPQVPRGWSMANGTMDAPGSIVRVRSSADPTPKFQGYGLRVQEARLSAAAK